MQFKKSAVFGVLIMLYLSTDSCCHYIPEKKTPASARKNDGVASHSEKIQICGNALTNFILEACDGIVGSFDPADSKRNSARTKITEDCCDRECPMDYLQSYCGEAPLFTTKKTLRGKLLNKLTKYRAVDSGAAEEAPEGAKKRRISEVSVREKNDGKRRPAKSRKKRKKSFKWKCAFKSFGHYLLRLDRRGRARHEAAKESADPNRTWPSIEVGTISPEMDKFGGQPIVVVRKNKSNSS